MEITNVSVRNDEDEEFVLDEKTWKKVMGSENWEGLLEPLDNNLRRFILRCGDFILGAYKAFSGNAQSSNIALPGPSGHYNVHSIFYATVGHNLLEKVLHIPAEKHPPREGDHNPYMMGFCAATSDEASRTTGRREIYVAWRGTKRLFEWRNNFMSNRVALKNLLCRGNPEGKMPKVMAGWLSIYTSKESYCTTSAKEQVKTKIEELLEKYEGENVSIVVSGHSLGGTLAILTAFDLVENVVSDDILVTAMVFGCPRVGNKAFKERLEQHNNLKLFHVRDCLDIIPRFPPIRYVKVGTELKICCVKSPFTTINASLNPGIFHDLEVMLHIVSGWSGDNEQFVPHVKRMFDPFSKNEKSFLYVKSEIELWIRRVLKSEIGFLN